MIHFFEGARHGGVPIFNVKTTRKANVPVVVALVDVWLIRIPNLRGAILDCCLERCNAAPIGDNLALDAHSCSALRSHVVREWGTSTSSTTASASATTVSCASARAEIPGGKLLLDRNRKLLDRGNVGDGPTCVGSGGGRSK